jgi:phosphoglycerol transferase MdoB-like AlkP superfamily enzyme
MFHVPAMILGGTVEPKVVDQVTTQPDVLATALDLIGLDLEYPILGKSIYDDSKNDVSLMQFNDFYALRVDDKVAVVRPGLPSETFLYQDQRLMHTSHDLELEKDAMAFIVTLNHLYDKRLFR